MPDYLLEVSENDPRRRNALIVERLRAAATMIENASAADPELPEVISVGVTGAEITLQPWLPGAPVTAMRKFESILDGPLDRKAFPLVLNGTEQVALLHLGGTTNGHPAVVTVSTYRDTPVDGFLGVTEQTVAEIADTEEVADQALLDEAEARVARDNGNRYELVAEDIQELGEDMPKLRKLMGEPTPFREPTDQEREGDV